MKLQYTYTLEVGDRFIVKGVIHEVCSEYIIDQEGKVVVTAGGSQFGLEVNLYHPASKTKVSMRSEKVMEELNCPGTHPDIQFVYPGDQNHLANKGIMATIADANTPDSEEIFDVGLWFITTRTNAVKELHAGNYQGGPALEHIGNFYRAINPRINRYFYAGNKTNIRVNPAQVENYLNRAAPILTGKLKFQPTPEEKIILAARR